MSKCAVENISSAARRPERGGGRGIGGGTPLPPPRLRGAGRREAGAPARTRRNLRARQACPVGSGPGLVTTAGVLNRAARGGARRALPSLQDVAAGAGPAGRRCEAERRSGEGGVVDKAAPAVPLCARPSAPPRAPVGSNDQWTAKTTLSIRAPTILIGLSLQFSRKKLVY